MVMDVESEDLDIVDDVTLHSEDPNATEYSSSFGDTLDEQQPISSDAEVQSNAAAFGFTDTVFRIRKKKLSNEWRKFIRPLMWRCKWMELRMKNIQTQLSSYSTLHSSTQFHFQHTCSRSEPWPMKTNLKPMKRLRRKRLEHTLDAPTYISQHNFFSYLAETKPSDPDNADEFAIAVATEQGPDPLDKLDSDDCTQLGEGDLSMDQLLCKIDSLHSWVKTLKAQIETVISKNAPKFSSSENLSLLAPHSPAFSAGNGDAMSPGGMYTSAQHLTDFDIGDLVLPESYGEADNVPDVIESTVGLLSAAEHPQFGDSNEDMVEDTVMQEVTAYVKEEEEEDVKPVVVPPPLNFPPNKKKRGERKPASVVWNKPCSLDSDSQ